MAVCRAASREFTLLDVRVAVLTPTATGPVTEVAPSPHGALTVTVARRRRLINSNGPGPQARAVVSLVAHGVRSLPRAAPFKPGLVPRKQLT